MTLASDVSLLNVVQSAAAKWADDLIDLGHRNTLLHYRDTKTGTLDLSAARAEAMSTLMASRKTRLNALISDPEEHRAACRRATSLRKRILQLDEEQGVQAGHLARGMLRVAAPAAGGANAVPPLRAPLLLQPVTLQPRTTAESDFTIEVTEEPEINPVLLYALSRQYGVDLDPDEFAQKLNSILEETADPADQVESAFRLLMPVLSSSRLTAELEDHTVIGIFSFEKLPMVQDLAKSLNLLAGHEVIAAIADHQPSVRALLDGIGDSRIPSSDDIPPVEEFLVLDADSSQQTAIGHVLAGHHVLIDGPPGTGKSQTIANIIAVLAAHGKRVLFVTEKRAAIEAVTNRLASVDLDHLVFDLHDKRTNRRHVATQLAESLERAAKETTSDHASLHRLLTVRRAQVARHATELHQSRRPWGVSYFEAQCRLAELPDQRRTPLRFRGIHLRDLSNETLESLIADLKDYVDADGLRVHRGESPWSRSTIRDERDLEQVILRLDEVTGSTLRTTRAELERLVTAAGLRTPDTLADWQAVMELFNGVTGILSTFDAQIYGEALEDIYHATGSRSLRAENNRKFGFWRRRSLTKQLRALCRVDRPSRSDLHDASRSALAQRAAWQANADRPGTPMAIEGLKTATEHYERLRDHLAAISLSAQIDPLDRHPVQEIESILGRMNGDRATLERMPRLNRLAEQFTQYGLWPLLDELAAKDATASESEETLLWAWLSSLLEDLRLHVPVLRDFTAQGHSRCAQEFQQADDAHRETNPQRVRRAIAENLRRARDSHPEQSRTVKDQAARKNRHMSIRRLIATAPDVLLAARPCWAMSPVVVSRMLPADRLFDVVIFDEASQVGPQDAITSIMRGRQLVVAGDPRQLPPSTFFQKVLGGSVDLEDDETADDLTVYDSILDKLSTLLPYRCRLTWHYRSRDERLITFSNINIYGGDLVTFPGLRETSPIQLDVVDGTAVPGQGGSTPQEVARVIELTLEHARTEGKESLGVITMGDKHAQRIEMALNAARREHPELDGFFSTERGPGDRFFIKSLENVQGDERDVIILSIGYPKQPGGKVPLRFGPINNAGGERRLNVAVTRARLRMTVVSSFSHLDLDPQLTRGATNKGPELLRLFLECAASGGTAARSSGIAPELNGFEQSVLAALQDASVPVHPQWGVGEYRIDFALAHPRRPGQMVLAVEADGERYHRTPTARERDRLRQEHLERLDWKFHRVWSMAWFQDPVRETSRIVESWRRAVDQFDHRPSPPPPPALVPPPVRNTPNRGARPSIPKHESIVDYPASDLVRICAWLLGDGLPLVREDRIGQAMTELGFRKRGRLILERLNAAFDQAERGAAR